MASGDVGLHHNLFWLNGSLRAGISKALDGKDNGDIPVPEVIDTASDEDEELDNVVVDYIVR